MILPKVPLKRPKERFQAEISVELVRRRDPQRCRRLERGEVGRDLLVELKFRLALTEETELALAVFADQVGDVVVVGVACVVRQG